MAFRRGVGRTATAAVTAVIVAFGGAVLAPNVSAQDCAGTISTSVATSGLPGGTWSVSDGCLSPDAFFEYSDGPIEAKAALSTVTYDDGHAGRVAAGVLTLGGGVGLSIVGVEDAATGLVKWSAVLGDYTTEGDTVSVTGDGVSLFPTEAATVSLSISGTGTDVSELLAPDGSPTTTAPEAPPVAGDEGETPEVPAAPSSGDPLPAPGPTDDDGQSTTTTAPPKAPELPDDPATPEMPRTQTTTTVPGDPTAG